MANKTIPPRPAAAKQWAEQQPEHLSNGQVPYVVEALDRLDLQRAPWPELVQEAPDYFRLNQERMRYDHFGAQSYPIGSGNIESAANTVVHHRMRRRGRGWPRYLITSGR